MRTREWAPDDKHRPFVIAADWLTGDRVDKCQPTGGYKSHLGGCLDSFPEPADGRISRNQHDGADLVLALSSGFLYEWRDIAVGRVEPGIAGDG